MENKLVTYEESPLDVFDGELGSWEGSIEAMEI